MTDDEGLCSLFFPLLDGWYEGSVEYLKAQTLVMDIAKKVRTRLASPHGDAYVVRGNTSGVPVNGILFDRGAALVVFLDGHNLGVVKRDDIEASLDHEAVHKLVDGEDGWFFHPNGWLVARGTRKAPAETPSMIEPEDLARAGLKAIR